MASRTGCLVGQSCTLTFDGLVRLVVGRSPRYAAGLEHELVLTQVLGETPVEALRDAVGFPGAVAALGRLLLQLAESGRDADELDRILALWAVEEPNAALLAGDVRRLARSYDGPVPILASRIARR